jgi:hypothetical protein
MRFDLIDFELCGSHYFYRIKGEYSVPMTPKGGWFRRYTSEETTPKPTSGSLARNISNRKPARKRLILSQTMVIDVDPNKVSFKGNVSAAY